MLKNRRSLFSLVGLVAIIGFLFVVVPAVSAAPPPPIQLILGDGPPRFESGSAQQLITTASNGCQIDQGVKTAEGTPNSAETLIDLDPQANTNVRNRPLPGLSSDSIGIKGTDSNSNGTPCSQVTSDEELVIKPGSTLSGRSFEKVVLDLEMTGNAITEVTLDFVSGSPLTYRLHTGTNFAAFCAASNTAQGCPGAGGDAVPSTVAYDVVLTDVDGLEAACASPNSSGPNSGANDNCIWTIDPGEAFDVVSISVDEAAGGTASLEGGSDTGQPSEFHLANAAPVVTNPGQQSDADGDTVSLQIVATDVDSSSLSYSASGLPSGLSIDSTTGLISGTIDDSASDGSPYSVSVSVSDGETTTTISFQWDVADTICTTETVFDIEEPVAGNPTSGYFTKLTGDGPAECKVYAVDATIDQGIEKVSFIPQGAVDVTYRAFIELGGNTPPAVGSMDGVTLFLEYDPTGTDASYQPVSWCISPVFGATVVSTEIPLISWLGGSVAAVTEATIPTNESWCIAAAYVRDVGGELVTTWQLYGLDDPNFK